MILDVIVVVVVFAAVVGGGVFAGYQVGYGNGEEIGYNKGYAAAMDDNREEHYLTD